MADINRLIALNPFQARQYGADPYTQTLAGFDIGRQRQTALERQAIEEREMRRLEAERQRQQAQTAQVNRMMAMGSGPMELARAGFLPQAEQLAGIQDVMSESQRRRSQSEIEREKLGVEWAKLKQSQQQRAAQPQNERTVQQAQMLPGGGARILYKDGSIEVRRPEEVDAKFIQDAELRGAEIQGLRAGERKAAGIAQDKSKDAFEQAFKIRENVGTLYDVINEVKAGAGTGPLKSRLPSLKAASVRLDNLQKKLGLDLINSVTFGALSEGELKLALETALPTQMDGPELIKWTEDKIASQTKLAGELEDLAIYLGTPGNNLATFLTNQKQERNKPQKRVQQELDPLGIR